MGLPGCWSLDTTPRRLLFPFGLTRNLAHDGTAQREQKHRDADGDGGGQIAVEAVDDAGDVGLGRGRADRDGEERACEGELLEHVFLHTDFSFHCCYVATFCFPNAVWRRTCAPRIIIVSEYGWFVKLYFLPDPSVKIFRLLFVVVHAANICEDLFLGSGEIVPFPNCHLNRR